MLDHFSIIPCTDPFKRLPDFPPQRLISTTSNDVRSIREGNTVKMGDVFINKKHLINAVAQFALKNGF